MRRKFCTADTCTACAPENRHPVHLSTTLDVKEDFISTAQLIRSEKIVGEALWIDACDFSYQQDEQLLRTIDLFMK